MKKTYKDYITVLFGSGFARGLALLSSIIIARLLGPEEFGKFSIFYIIMILVWLLPQAFDTTFVRYAKAANSKREKNEFLKTAVFLKLVYFVTVLCISYPLAYFLANYCFHKPYIQFLLMASMVCGGFLSFLMSIASTFQEKEKFTEFAVLNTSYTALILCALLLLKASNLEFSLRNVVLIYLAITIAIGIISIMVLFKKIGKLFPLNAERLKISFSLGKWIFGVTCVYFIFQRLDILFLTRYVDLKLIGIYSASTRLIIFVALMTGSLAGVSLPKANAAIKSKSLLKTYVKESVISIIIIDIFIILLIIGAPFCIKILFGNEYLLAGIISRLLLIGWFFVVVYTPFSFLFYALDDSRTRFLLELLKIITAIILLYWLVPKYNLIGGAIAMSLSLVLNTFISLTVLRHKLTGTYERFKVC
ncbi:MAG: hypothetical protein AMJ43_10385 [Coxiella sp. DG_40]|nr:MAG: hypothetical protein AMJ43_10385 [Coxiella sp. DG_40]